MNEAKTPRYFDQILILGKTISAHVLFTNTQFIRQPEIESQIIVQNQNRFPIPSQTANLKPKSISNSIPNSKSQTDIHFRTQINPSAPLPQNVRPETTG